MSVDTRTEKRLEQMEELTDVWLQAMLDRIKSGEATPTDFATAARFLLANGVTLDPTRIPQGLKDLVTERVRYDEDPDVG